MKKQVFFILSFIFIYQMAAQETQSINSLFDEHNPLKVKLNYSNKEMNKKTNDSTYIKTDLSYMDGSSWKTFEVDLRARGNFRRAKCYFPPIKMKIKKSNSEGTLFSGHKKLKLVLPCLMQKEKNDNILQELMAYKFYEIISPYHFKTRELDIEFEEKKGKKTKVYQLKAFLIEDDKKIAKRHDGKVFERYTHPLAMDANSSVQNTFFQYMIGNTDFSVAYQHNGKLLFANKKIIPLPYDFDMSGLVDASYAVANETLGISSVRQRKYRGFKRAQPIIDKVRDEFIANKIRIFEVIEYYKDRFELESEYSSIKDYIESFYKILEDDSSFQKNIVAEFRTK
jgi:hypothetical protein